MVGWVGGLLCSFILWGGPAWADLGRSSRRGPGLPLTWLHWGCHLEIGPPGHSAKVSECEGTARGLWITLC